MIERGRSGRPTETKPLAIGKEDKILKIGAIRKTILDAVKSNDGYRYGLRVGESQLTPGEVAPKSRQFFQGFISEDHPDNGREQFPDHGKELPGTSVIGLRSVAHIPAAMRAAGVMPMDWRNQGPYGGYYDGRYVSLVRSKRKPKDGYDPGEWIMPKAEVVATWDIGNAN